MSQTKNNRLRRAEKASEPRGKKRLLMLEEDYDVKGAFRVIDAGELSERVFTREEALSEFEGDYDAVVFIVNEEPDYGNSI